MLKKTGGSDGRLILILALVGLVLPAAAADNFPRKAGGMIVPFSAGLGEQFSRRIGQTISETWGHQLIVDNRPGGGVVGAGIAATRAGRLHPHPAAPPLIVNAILHTGRTGRSRTSRGDAGGLASQPAGLPSVFPAKSMKELIATARAVPASSTSARRPWAACRICPGALQVGGGINASRPVKLFGTP